MNKEFISLSTDRERAEYLRKLEGCQNAGQEFEEQAMPQGHEELAERLIEALSRTEQSTTVRPALQEYSDCLATHSIQASDWRELYMSVEKAFPPNPGTPTDITADPRWIKGRDYERQAASADAECRADLHDRALVAVDPMLARFEADNASALKEMDARWTSVAAEAAKLRESARAGN